jgi:hypothetical protein
MDETDEHSPESEPEAPIARPRRAHTILGRLSAAVREQNWFAVALEVVIVILGVVIGFQITTWGQSRSDGAKEKAYLLQLENDIQHTIDNLHGIDRVMASRELASAKLLRAFQLPSPPPRDSLLIWVYELQAGAVPSPTMRTVEALISTGDLRLLRNDSLQIRITEYAEFIEDREYYLQRNGSRSRTSLLELERHVDLLEVERARIEQGRAANSWLSGIENAPFPEGTSRTAFPLDVQAFLRDREAYFHVNHIYQGNHYVMLNRRDMRSGAEEMLDDVRAEIAARYRSE